MRARLWRPARSRDFRLAHVPLRVDWLDQVVADQTAISIAQRIHIVVL
jgi:hypothetical protein